jgi:hypothetical protein
MGKRWFVLGLLLLFVVFAVPAVENRVHRRMINSPGGSEDTIKICTTVYYRVCTESGCIADTGAGSCCGDCRTPEGSFAPCNKCTAS